MITNFEDITEDLSQDELFHKSDIQNYLEILLTGKKLNPVKQKDIVEKLNIFLSNGKTPSIKITPIRLRKYFNYFRSTGSIPLIATSEGCYISKDKQEIEKQILSLNERARQIMRASEGLQKFLKT